MFATQPVAGFLPRLGWLLPGAAFVILAVFTVLQVAFGYFNADLSGHALGTDDAFISFRYAQNLAEGHGLSFNPGESIEGFSNLLFVLLLAPWAGVLDGLSLYHLACALSIGIAGAALALLYLYARRFLPAGSVLATLFLFSFCPTLWIALGSGMETSLIVFSVVAHLAFSRLVLERRAGNAHWLAASLLVAMTILARADGFILPLGFAVFFVVRGERRAAWRFLCLTLAFQGLLVAWRLWQFGFPFPNTYYAKASDALADRLPFAAKQLTEILTKQGLIVHLVVVVAHLVRVARGGFRRVKDELKPEALLSIILLAYFLFIGGDVLYDRMLVVLFPMGVVLFFSEAPHWKLRWAQTVGMVLLVAAHAVPFLADPRMRYQADKYDRWVNVQTRVLFANGYRYAVLQAGPETAR